MYTIILGIIVAILSATIALLALSIGGFAKVLKALYYLRFPPAKFYFNAMRAIERLEALSDKPSVPNPQQTKQGIVGSSDVGFNELIKILRENSVLIGEADEIVLVEADLRAGISTGNISLTPTKIRILGSVKDGNQESLIEEQWDIYRITRNLKDWVLEVTRNSVSKWIIWLIAFYLMASIAILIIK